MESTTKKFHQYFSSRPKISITMTNGNRINFVGGVYLTDQEAEIEFLDHEVKMGNKMITVRDGQKVVDADALDPLAAVKKRAIEEYLEQQKLNSDPNRDMGKTNPDISASISTTKSISAITVPSSLKK